MTKQKLPAICDFCAKEISSEMKYTAQLSQTGEKGVRGEFITTANKCDMCQNCFLEVCRNGYKQLKMKIRASETTTN